MEMEWVKSKFNLPGRDFRVKQWLLRWCPSRALRFQLEVSRGTIFSESWQNEDVKIGLGGFGPYAQQIGTAP